MLPIIFKPESVPGDYDPDKEMYKNNILTFPDLLTIDEIPKLVEYAKSNTGLHRRGSKSELVTASFSTCLIMDNEHPIYDRLNYIWDNSKYSTFIEPYEIKIYTDNDSFGSHHDLYFNKEKNISRQHLLVVQLSNPSEYEGGNLIVGPHVIERKMGLGVMFPANYIHKVTPITRGERITLIGHSWGNM